LADRLAADTKKGIPEAAAAIVKVVTSPGSDSPAICFPSRTRLLLNLLETNPVREAIIDFLQYHRELLESVVLDIFGEPGAVQTGSAVGFEGVPFCVGATISTAGTVEITLIEFADVGGPFLDADGKTFAADIKARMASLCPLVKAANEKAELLHFGDAMVEKQRVLVLFMLGGATRFSKAIELFCEDTLSVRTLKRGFSSTVTIVS
jgi:hypothetical protein